MQLRENVSGFPLGTAGGGDFVTGNPLAPGDRIIDLDVDLDARGFGRVCLSESTVKLMAEMIGWQAPDQKAGKKLAKIEAERDAAVAERDLLRNALNQIINVRELLAAGVLESL